ncbi:MAG: glycosyltransferase family 9 protein [Acidobacteria bacterium]|nr:glycosyltransferase family 9 protein [Acidobacteriota bacterium]
MSCVLDRLLPGSRIAVIRLRSLGDCVLTTPALALLKTARPDLEIAVVVEEAWEPVFEGNPDVAIALPPSAMAIRLFGPDLCLNLHENTRSLALTVRSGARYRAGFQHSRASWLYNVRIPPAQQILGVDRKLHTAEQFASAMFHLGVPPAPIPATRLFAAAPEPRSPYAVIHPLASEPGRTWPAGRFLEAARWIRHSLALEPLFLGGPAGDLSPFDEFTTFRGQPLEAVKRLLRGASLFLGNAGGPAHLAAAFRIPLVVLFGTSDPLIRAPWSAPSEVLTAGDALSELPVSLVINAMERLKAAA